MCVCVHSMCDMLKWGENGLGLKGGHQLDNCSQDSAPHLRCLCHCGHDVNTRKGTNTRLIKFDHNFSTKTIHKINRFHLNIWRNINPIKSNEFPVEFPLWSDAGVLHYQVFLHQESGAHWFVPRRLRGQRASTLMTRRVRKATGSPGSPPGLTCHKLDNKIQVSHNMSQLGCEMLDVSRSPFDSQDDQI